MNSVEPLSSNGPLNGLRLAPAEVDAEPLARFVAQGIGAPAPGAFALPLELLAGEPAEAWWTHPAMDSRAFDERGIRALAAGDWLVCEAHWPGDDAPEEAARVLYRDLLTLIEGAGFPHIVKCWNYLSLINEGAGDAERYKQFCVGRGEALDQGWSQDYWPSATGVGNDAGEGLRVMLLASRQRPELIENPRQVSAFRYPRQYGPKSPNFSRAAVIGEAGHRLLFISGTAAIVGHDSLHTTSVEDQVDETLRNWTSLFDAVEARGERRPALASEGWYRVYLRRPDDLDAVRHRLDAAGLPLDRTLFFRADICRSELLFEMDGVIAIPGSNAL